MGDPPSGLDPPFDEAYWVEATTKAALFLRNYIGGDHGRAWECIARAVQRARPGGDQAWDPGKYAKLSVYLYYRGRTIFLNEERSRRRRWKRETVAAPDWVERIGSGASQPEAAYASRESSRGSRLVLHDLRERLAEDPDAVRVIDLIDQDVLKLRHQVEKLAWPEPRVRNARKRIARAYRKLRSAPRSEG